MSNWLKKLREENNFTQKELALRTGITISTIQNIEQGKRKGSAETLKILNNYFNDINSNFKFSFDCKELIEELKQDILEFGEEELLYAMFETIDNRLLLTNYDFIDDEKPLSEKEIKEYCLIIELKAKDILNYLELQNKIM